MLRPYTTEDHPTIAAWWGGHGFPVIPSRIIPPFAFIEHDPHGSPRAFACAYLDNGGTGVAMLEWIVTNPGTPPRQTLTAINDLIPFMRDHLVSRLGYTVILATCRQPALSRLLQRHQFQLTDRDMSHHLFTSA